MSHAARGRSARTQGVNSRLLSYEAAMTAHRDMDPQGLLTRDVMRAMITSQQCPYCDRGPFKVLAVHTNKAHGIGRLELRHLAGLTTTDSISSAEFAERARVLAEQRGFGHSEAARRGRENRDGGAAVWGTVSRERIAVANRKRMAETPYEVKAANARRAAAALTPEGRQRRIEANKRRTLSPEHLSKLLAAAQAPDVVERLRIAREERRQGHGTVACYKRGCRCEPCRDAKRTSRKKKNG